MYYNPDTQRGEFPRIDSRIEGEIAFYLPIKGVALPMVAKTCKLCIRCTSKGEVYASMVRDEDVQC